MNCDCDKARGSLEERHGKRAVLADDLRLVLIKKCMAGRELENGVGGGAMY
jgi:hypothetical protein